MNINISDEAIHKISEKIKEQTNIAKADSELEFLELLENGGQNLVKFIKEEPLSTKEAKSAIAIGMTICLVGNEIIEEICEQYSDAEKWWTTFLKD